jgi:hypothetical protein
MARKADKEARRELHELFMRRFGDPAYLENPPPPPTIPEIARDAKIARREYEVALAHISELVDSAPDPNFSREALARLLGAAYMLATTPAAIMAAMTGEIDDRHRHNGAVNGRRSGEKRLACAWGAYVDERAQQIWTANKSLNCSRIAQLIYEKWPSDVPGRPRRERSVSDRVRKLNLT